MIVSLCLPGKFNFRKEAHKAQFHLSTHIKNWNQLWISQMAFLNLQIIRSECAFGNWVLQGWGVCSIVIYGHSSALASMSTNVHIATVKQINMSDPHHPLPNRWDNNWPECRVSPDIWSLFLGPFQRLVMVYPQNQAADVELVEKVPPVSNLAVTSPNCHAKKRRKSPNT